MSSLRKNVASQNITFQLTNVTTGSPVTAGASGNVSKDGGAQAAAAGVFTHLGTGQWNYAPTQAETNATAVGFQFTGTGAIVINLHFFTDNWDTTQAVLTSGAGANQLSVSGTGKVSEVVLVDALTTYTGNTPQTGDAFVRLGAPAGASTSADIAAVKADLDAGVTISAAGNNAIADALLDRSNAVELGITPRLAWRYIAAACTGVLAGAATTNITISGIGVATTRISATVDSVGDRSAVALS